MGHLIDNLNSIYYYFRNPLASISIYSLPFTVTIEVLSILYVNPQATNISFSSGASLNPPKYAACVPSGNLICIKIGNLLYSAEGSLDNELLRYPYVVLICFEISENAFLLISFPSS
ncbi:hypothetical protein [Bacillus cereus group sp. BfR-BA-01524]|uniref:hypothetical protein n=1 Tax=Bacillus cereus group sp. BfR-BA-01524 TaxID=2920372 RepID=UPI001F576D72